jgi:aspartate kinase
MQIKVMKFGGTSVATAEARQLAAHKVIAAKEAGFHPVVVVSAIGRQGAPYATDTLMSLLHDVDPLVLPDAREVDLMLCCGEIMSTCIFAQTLKSMGHAASAMTGGQAGLVTDSTFGNARIIEVLPDGVFAVLRQGRIPVVCGFQGRSKASENAVYGEITTLGRGGSDTTASALGAALGAVAVEIYSDVDGVKTSDPAMVPFAPTLRKMTYEEIAEIAHQGAKVVHPRAAEIAMKFGIPLHLKCTFTDEPGTEVVTRDNFPGRRVTGVTHTGKLVYLQFEAPFGSDKGILESKVYQLMADYRINLFMLNVHPNSFGFAVPRKQLPNVKEILDGLVIPLIDGSPRTYIVQVGRAGSTEVAAQERMLAGNSSFGEIRKCTAKLTENCTMVSVIAHDYLNQPGIYERVMRCLKDASINVLQTSDSPLSLSLLVSETDCERAVCVLHDEFELAEAI